MAHLELTQKTWYRRRDHLIFAVIMLNSVVIFLQASGYEYMGLNLVDAACTVVFILEMAMKHYVLGTKGYWKDGWNKMDGILVLLSIPAHHMVYPDGRRQSECADCAATLARPTFLPTYPLLRGGWNATVG